MDGDKEQQQQDRTVKVQRKRKRAHETKKKSMLAIQMIQAEYGEEMVKRTLDLYIFELYNINL